MTFSITGAVNCDYCGDVLSESSDSCDECADSSRDEMVFSRFGGGGRCSVMVARSAKPSFYWEKFARSLDGEDPRRFALLGTQQYVDGCEAVGRGPSMMATAIDYSGSKDLRELASYSTDT